VTWRTTSELLGCKSSTRSAPTKWWLPRRQLMDDSAVVDFLLAYVGKFDLYVEDQCPAYVRYCFEEPMDAAIFRSRFAAKSERFRLAG
jgi:hypothetical protein